MKSKTHVFAVAVEQYQETSIPTVAYAENDVREFVNAWIDLGVEAHDIVTLVSSSATKTIVESRLKAFLANVLSGERIVFFYAGQGVAFVDSAHLTAYDTQLDDPRATSIPLKSIFAQLRASKADQVLLFLDDCHGEIPIAEGMRSNDAGLSDFEVKEFCDGSESHVAFMSSGLDESSYSSQLLKHGVWAYSVIECLRGNADEAFARPGIITGESLRGYVAREVPLHLRKAFTNKMRQTPCVFGTFTKEFVVADLGALLEKRRESGGNLAGILKQANLFHERRGRIRQLSGFSKGHKEPTYHSPAATSFVESVGEAEVRALAEEIHARVREAFSYRRKELDCVVCSGGASIKTPDFDVDISMLQDKENATEFVLTTTVSILEPDILSNEEFLRVFTKYCDTVVFEMSSPIDVEAKIDLIEESDALREFLEYDAESTYLKLSLPDPDIVLRIEPYRITFSREAGSDLEMLLEQTKSVVGILDGAGVLNLSESAD